MKHSYHCNIFLIFCLLIMGGSHHLYGQENKPGFYITGQSLVKVGSEDTLYIKGDLQNSNSNGYLTIHNVGHIFLTGDLVDKGEGLFQSSSYANSNPNPDSIGTKATPTSELKTFRGNIYFVGDSIQTIRSEKDTSIWLANIHLRNTVKLESSLRVSGILDMRDSLDLNGHHINHYIYEDFNYTGNWGKLANETNTTFIYDSNTNKTGYIKMLKRKTEFNDFETTGLAINAIDHNAKANVGRGHKRDMSVTSGTIQKYYDILKSESLRENDALTIAYFDRDFNPRQQAEVDFALWEIRTDNVLPHAIRLESVLDVDANTISSSDKISYTQGMRYSVATTRCSNSAYINLGEDTILCAGNSLTLSSSVTEYTPIKYQWKHIEKDSIFKSEQVNDGKSFFMVQDSGTYMVKAIDKRGCESLDTIKVGMAPKPKPIIHVDALRLCESAPFTFSYADTSSANISHILWDFKDGTTSTDSLTIKSYPPVCKDYGVKLTAFSDLGCTDTSIAHVQVEQRKQPKIDLLTLYDTIATFKVKDVLIGCTPSVTAVTWYINNDSIATMGENDNLTYHFPTYANYIVGMRMKGLCTAMAEDTIYIKPKGMPLFITSKKDYCVGENILIENKSEENEIGTNFSYQWNYANGRTSSGKLPNAFAYAKAGKYAIVLTMDGGGGWIRTYTDTLTIHDNPKINFGGEISHCKSQYVLKPEETQPYYSYEWKLENSLSGSQETLLATVDGNYTLTVENTLYGCRTSELVSLTLNNDALHPRLGGNTEACGNFILDAHNPNANYEWNTGAATRELNVTQTGTYSVHVWDTAGCHGFDTVQITIHERPNADLGNDFSICDNENMVLQTPDNVAGATYIWSTGATTSSIGISSGGFYSVQVTHANGICKVSDTIFIIENQAPVVSWDGGDKHICNNQSIVLSQQNQYYADEIRWTYPDGNTVAGLGINTEQEGLHYVYVRYASGCSATDSIAVKKSETKAVANFMLSNKIERNDSVQLINLSYPEPLTYQWKIDNISFSTEENPQLICHSGSFWMNKDTIDILLTVDDGACPVSRAKQIIVLSETQTKILDLKTGEEIIIGDTIYSTNYTDMFEANLFPNPTTGWFALELKLTAETVAKYVITTSTGQILMKKVVEVQPNSKIDFNISHYPKGIYLLHLGVGNKTKIFKIVKN